jgi:putative endonuclease
VTNRRRIAGTQGEQAAAEMILSKGYSILQRNWRCRSGELDIVAKYGSTIVIIEVRTRTAGGRFGTAAESVDARKQHQVRTTAEVFLHVYKLHDLLIRFDVMTVTINRETTQIDEITHIEAAF